MNFVQAIKSGFANYTNFAGRSSRSEYWFWTLFLLIAGICTSVADLAIFGNTDLSPINLIFNLIVAIPGVAVSVRRLHDINRTGWWLLLLLTIVGLLVLIYWSLKAGDTDQNRFGNNPLTRDESDAGTKENSGGVKVAITIALFFAGILILGIAAAIALTAYDEYSRLAREQDNQTSAPPKAIGAEPLATFIPPPISGVTRASL